ncbi:MAG: serine/threonine-protein kinase, partial [Pseudomonadota bacterium]
MSKLRNPIHFETTFEAYTVDEQLGEGGAGRVYGGVGCDDKPIALKLLAKERTTSEKRRRFKNEIAFLARNKHPNIVSVIDHGLDPEGSPFYVMKRYDNNLRKIICEKNEAEDVLNLFSQMLDGIEAAHLQDVIHRDIKPENFLFDENEKRVAVADFGIASFTDDLLVTAIETTGSQRLANFQYAAPEQRVPGEKITKAADIYALGLILNELFTRKVPHGTNYVTIGSIAQEMAFLDPIVASMLQQKPEDRPQSIFEIKTRIQLYKAEAVSHQRLSLISETVIPSEEIDEPLAVEPPRLANIDWKNGTLTLFLDRPVNADWQRALSNMRHYTSVMGIGPDKFRFTHDKAVVSAAEQDVQQVVNFFKDWLPIATQELRFMLEQEAK